MSENPQRGELFILSGPSGTGKTTLIHRLMERRLGGLAFSVSHTTRKPREGEVDGRDYHFVDHATFDAMIAAGRFLEWEKVHDNCYGTSRDEVFPRLEQGTDVILDIDVKGAEDVLAQHQAAVSIFLLPPSFEDMEARLRRRALDEERAIRGRLDVSLWEITRYDRYGYVIINDDADRASEVLAAVILERRHRRERMRGRIQNILKDFQNRGS